MHSSGLIDNISRIFLTASPEARAQRRLLELREKGIDLSLSELIRQQTERDKRDASRDVAPMKPAEDAVLLDNSKMNLEETIAEVLRIAEEKELTDRRGN